MKINNRKEYAEVDEESYKYKCVFVRGKIKEVIYGIQTVIIPEFNSLTEINPNLTIHKFEYISELLVRWYNTISQDVDGVSIGGMLIHCNEECVTTTVNSLYLFFNSFDAIYTLSRYTIYMFLCLCKRYYDCKYEYDIFNSKLYRENECKLLEYIRALSKCETLDEVIDIYRQAIKP